MNGFKTRIVLAVMAAVLLSGSASAQVFGTFSWQMQPYCNVITLTITQFPAGYTVDGNDNQCGAATLASATGQVHINPDGTVGVNFAIIAAPAGKAVHVAAVLSPANGSGTWTDSVGNSGAFALGANTGGSPRPLPASGLTAASITNVEIANNSITGAKVANGSLTSVDLADSPRAAFSGGDQFLALTTVPAIVRTVSLTIPANGQVVVNAVGLMSTAGGAATRDVARCSISTNSALDLSFSSMFGEEAGTPTDLVLRGSVSMIRSFPVSAGVFTANVVCDVFTGSVNLIDSAMSAMYFPG